MKLYRKNYSLFRMKNSSLVLCVLVAVLAVTQGDYDKNNNNRYDGRYLTQSNGPHAEYFTNDNAISVEKSYLNQPSEVVQVKPKQAFSYNKDPDYHNGYDWPSKSNTNTQKAVAYNHDPTYYNQNDWSVDGKLKNVNLAPDIKESTVININNPDRLFSTPILIDESNSFDYLKNLNEKPLSDQPDITENRPISEHIQNLDVNERTVVRQPENYIYQKQPDLDHDENFDGNANSLGDHTDNYIKLNKLQLDDLMAYFHRKLEHMKKNFLLRSEGIHLIRDLVTDRIIQNEEDLNPTTLLSDVHKQCVDEHRSSLLPENVAESSINLCYTTAQNELSNILKDARDTAQKFEEYYKQVYLPSLAQCPRDESYTQCVLKATVNAITFSTKSKKTFDSQINIAICRVKEAIKEALECAYDIQVNATTKITEAKKYIDKCIYDLLNCKKCPDVTCDEYTTVSSAWESLQNPLYGLHNQTYCIRLERY